jgi:hypothetical protein
MPELSYASVNAFVMTGAVSVPVSRLMVSSLLECADA